MPRSNKTVINVRNVGPIRSGTFELRPLTVFTGNNNSGKSWLASIVYALFSFPRSTKYRAYLRERCIDVHNKYRAKQFIRNPVRWIENLEKHDSIELNDEEVKEISSILDFDRQAKLLAEEIHRCHRSIEPKNEIRTKTNAEAAIRVKKTEITCEKCVSTEYILDVKNSISGFTTPIRERISVNEGEKRSIIQMLRYASGNGIEDKGPYPTRFFLDEIVDLVNRKVMFTTNKALYLPAERVGLINNYRTFVSSVLQEKTDHNSFQSSGVNLDFVKKLLDIPQFGNELDISSEANSLEEKMLHGKIEVAYDSFSIPQFFYNSSFLSERIPLSISSAMVSQIAPVVLFLRYYGNSHRMFIIEEPEAHLHPESQVKFIEEICSWVRSGYQVLLTTHSEWIIEALSNQVLAHDIGIPNGLDAKKVGVWDVVGSNDGSSMREIKWKPDESGYDDGFDRVADVLSNRWFDYQGRLQ